MNATCLNCHATLIPGEDSCPLCMRSQTALRRTLGGNNPQANLDLVQLEGSAPLASSAHAHIPSSSSIRARETASASSGLARSTERYSSGAVPARHNTSSGTMTARSTASSPAMSARVPSSGSRRARGGELLESQGERKFSTSSWLVAALGIIVLAAGYPLSADGIEHTADLDARTQQAPVYSETNREPFEFNYDGDAYKVTPRGEYEFHGVLASRTETHGQGHALCAVVGEGLDTNAFRKMNAVSTSRSSCYVSSSAHLQLDMKQVANSHVIAQDDAIHDTIADLKPGDQIRIQGLLVDYISQEAGIAAKTSLKRDDAMAEVIFAEEVEVIRPATPVWYAMVPIGWVLLLGGVLSRVGLFVASVRD